MNKAQPLLLGVSVFAVAPTSAFAQDQQDPRQAFMGAIVLDTVAIAGFENPQRAAGGQGRTFLGHHQDRPADPGDAILGLGRAARPDRRAGRDEPFRGAELFRRHRDRELWRRSAIRQPVPARLQPGERQVPGRAAADARDPVPDQRPGLRALRAGPGRGAAWPGLGVLRGGIAGGPGQHGAKRAPATIFTCDPPRSPAGFFVCAEISRIPARSP